MIDSNVWDHLSRSSKAALRWACAAAATQSGAADHDIPGTAELLIGIVLAHRPDSEAQQLFSHFQIPISAVMNRLARQSYNGRGLLEHYLKTPPDVSLSLRLGDELEGVVRHAASALPNPDPDGFLPLRVLFGALLEITNPVSQAIREELASRGVEAEAVILSYREFLVEQRNYTDFLRERHPFVPLRPEVPAILADQALLRGATASPGKEPVDLIGIQPEVDAFAYLIASRALVPPLAIGLFGDWGSGKSFFLRSLQRRIDTLTAETVAEQGRFYPYIAQVEFNAWQYVGGDLWASLLEHLFRNLRTSADEPDSVLVARQRELITQIEAKRLDRAGLAAEITAKEQERNLAAEVVETRRAQREESLAILEQRLRERPLAGWQPTAAVQTAVSNAAKQVGLTPALETIEELRNSIGEARLTLQRASPILQPLRTGGWRYVVAVICVALLPSLLWLILMQADISLVQRTVTAVASFVALGVGYVRLGVRWVNVGLDQLAEAQRQLDEGSAEERTRLDDAVTAAEQHLVLVSKQLNDAQIRKENIDAEAAALEQTLSETTASRVLTEFVAERTGSDDYRKRLGIQALVRQDLERLSELVAGSAMEQYQNSGFDQDADLSKTTVEAPSLHPINRVVLYIDDLDRCPTKLVIEVLQAVHLLLAFPLFVVVVAVDSRWLRGALADHYRGLLTGATPDDYLEKIFQVPFWVRPLDANVRRGMARMLLAPSLSTQTSEDSSQREQSIPDEGEVGEEFFELVESFTQAGDTPVELNAAPLIVTAQELGIIDEIAPLLGTTPRSIKRFVNIFQLVKSIGRRRRLHWDDMVEPPTFARVILLLAVSIGMPEFASAFFDVIEQHRSESLPLGKAVDDLSAPGHERVASWLQNRSSWEDVDLVNLLPWINLIRRFAFVSAR